jgi:hypothetical protein
MATQFAVRQIVRAVGERSWDPSENAEALEANIAATYEALKPRTETEGMLARLIVIHFHLIEDAAHASCHAETEVLRARARSAVLSLGRSLTRYMKQLDQARAQVIETAETGAPDEPVPPAPDPEEAFDALSALLTNAGDAPGNRAQRRAAKAKFAKAERALARVRARAKARAGAAGGTMPMPTASGTSRAHAAGSV